jgi:hypothetical protein
MPLNLQSTRQHLQNFDFRKLFNELGWNNPPHALTPADAEAKGGLRFHRAPVAELSGITVFEITTTDGTTPEPNECAAIHTAVTKIAAENILIFMDKARTQCLLYWVKREAGKSFRRPHRYIKGQPGDLFISKLDALRVDISELDALGNLAPGEGNKRVKKALDVERVTKNFYDQFQKEHAAFLKSFADCIPVKSDAEWYASVMLNRLMFVYFIQRKGFLDNDRDYLRTRLNLMRAEHGRDKFHSFYRFFLIKLFHEGLGGKKRPAELEKLLGTIPYLNGGMFDVHELEKKYDTAIEIPDAAFERIFDYFDKYDWVLDPEHTVRQPGDKEEINPDVLGYIFEKYINQKQMGAYYTKEDITEYISKNTIIPFLFDAARKECSVAFENPSGPTVWDLLARNPDRYIYAAVKKGVDLPLPKDIEAGIKDVSKRDGWNKSADAEFALPTEIWREVVARRTRCEGNRKKLESGEVRDINDLITLNLDIRRFAQEVIANCEGTDLLRAIWHAITTITVLDPTCGSGAFIFAALNILEPLYEACLARMTEFLNDETVKHDAAKLKFTAHGYPLLPGGKFEDFAQTLEHVAQHVSPQYFIYKSIILQNLFGVDIMPEAVEICKLRLFLKLAAQVEPNAKEPNLGIEPLPDIDFNICAGNTLVGYATLAELENSMFGREYLPRIQKLDERIREFRKRQSQANDLAEQREDKQQIRLLLDEIREKLDLSLYSGSAKPLTEWRKSHQPFHWYVEFNSIIQSGGFDVIIGNPPYVEKRTVESQYQLKSYETETTNNLYAYCSERAFDLLARNGRFGFIVPLSSMSTDKFEPLQRLVLQQGSTWLSNFDDRPSRLFDGLEHIQLTIILTVKTGGATALPFTTACRKWSADERINLFSILSYAQLHRIYLSGSIAKAGTDIEVNILDKLWDKKMRLANSVRDNGRFKVFYTRKVHAFLNVLDFVPKIYDDRGKLREPSEQKTLEFDAKKLSEAALCALNSTLFRWFLACFSDCRNLNRREVLEFPVNLTELVETKSTQLSKLADLLSEKLQDTSETREMRFKDTVLKVQCIIPRFSKPIIDEIDRELARHYGFTAAELDFIINYDIKYRLGRDTENEEE